MVLIVVHGGHEQLKPENLILTGIANGLYKSCSCPSVSYGYFCNICVTKRYLGKNIVKKTLIDEEKSYPLL